MSFAYFAYGSNLLTKRIQINNPSAIRIGIGKLENFRLDFITYSSRWKGCSATIVPTPGSSVWGSVWELDNKDLKSLDKQEGVADKIYFPMEVDIIMSDGNRQLCRTYQQCNTPPLITNMFDLPVERRPSAVYLNTIILGAFESKLPDDYQEFLKSIPHNDYDGDVDIKLDLSIT